MERLDQMKDQDEIADVIPTHPYIENGCLRDRVNPGYSNE
jgi:hypothetical protein